MIGTVWLPVWKAPAVTAVPALHRRGDVQGLRGIAVLLVIGLHSIGIPRGGFAGVDMFFVISGFVITAGLLREAEASGTVSLRGFYLRRLQRIAPAALVTASAVTAVAAIILPAVRAAGVAADAGWAAVGAENLWLILSGATHPVFLSPLVHFWSLGVEEQFYLVWPVLMLAAWRVGVRFGAPRRWVLAVAVTASMLSLAAGVWGSLSDPSAAYFSTVARGWELGTGCVLAVTVTSLERMPQAVRIALSFGGVIALGVGCSTSGQEAFPLPGALLPVGGAAALIAAGTGGGAAVTVILGGRWLRRVGDVSYSLYLWHLPVFVLMMVLQPQAGLDVLAESLAVTVLLAVLSYRFVEQPLLSRWSSPTRSRSTVSPVSSPTPIPSTP